MTGTSRTTTFRRRCGATTLVAAAGLFTAAELLFPAEGQDPVADLATNAAHHAQLLAAIGCYVTAALLFIPAIVALMNPVHGRGSVLTHLGGGLALLGNALSGLVLGGVQLVQYEASAPGVDRAAVGTFLARVGHDPVGLPLVLGHEVFALGLLLLAIGLFRARAGYRWASVCLGLAPLVDAVLGSLGLDSAGIGGMAVPLLSDGLLLAGAWGLAWWQATTGGPAWEGRDVGAGTGPDVPAAVMPA